jgi:fatty acid-binding protein DegV
MSLLQIFTDNLADLPAVFLEQHQIQLVPVYVVFNNDKVFKDKVDLSTDQICKLCSFYQHSLASVTGL